MEPSPSPSNSGSIGVMADGMAMNMYSCDGVLLPQGGGTWKGHVYPGLLFFLWGLYWMTNTFRRQLQSQSLGKAFRSKPWYPCLAAGRWLYAVEPFLKLIGPPIGISMELYFDSKAGFRPLYCEDSGHFAGEYVHNYQHASSYPAFFVSGLVDFAGLFLNLPPGTEHAFLSMAFGIEGFLMTMHKKHLALDMVTHTLLGYTMLAGALGVILELRAPHNFLVSVFRAFAVMLQGVWLMAMGEMMFSDSKSWNEEYNGPAMMAPAWFAMLTLLAAAGVLMLWVAMDWWHRRTAQYSSLPQTVKAGAPAEEAPHDSAQFVDFALEDSANETSDDGSEASPDDRQPKPKTTRQQLAVALTMLKPSARQSLGKAPSKSNEHIV